MNRYDIEGTLLMGYDMLCLKNDKRYDIYDREQIRYMGCHGVTSQNMLKWKRQRQYLCIFMPNLDRFRRGCIQDMLGISNDDPW